MDDIAFTAAGKHNTTSAAAKAFSNVGSSSLCHSSARCTVAICRAFGVRHASTFKVITLFPSLNVRPVPLPPRYPLRAMGLAISQGKNALSGGHIRKAQHNGVSVVLEKGYSKFFSTTYS